MLQFKEKSVSLTTAFPDMSNNLFFISALITAILVGLNALGRVLLRWAKKGFKDSIESISQSGAST